LWSVYILRCGDGSLYTGITKDVARRVAAHNAGRASKCTRSRRPVTLVYTERFRSRSRAARREARIKKLPAAAKRHLVKPEGP